MVINSLSAEVGVSFISCWWGAGLALGFKGDPYTPEASKAAVERCYNWAHNTGVTKGALCWVYDRGSSIGYVTTNQADILKGLAMQFRAEAIMAREIAPLVEQENEETGEWTIEYDEDALERLAAQRATRFYEERISYEGFLTSLAGGLGPVYGVGHLARSGSVGE